MRPLTLKRSTRYAAATLGLVVALFLVLAMPGPAPTVADAPAGARGFAWDRDSLWRALESSFVAARAAGGPAPLPRSAPLVTLRGAIAGLRHTRVAPAAALLDTVESRFFALAPLVAACPTPFEEYVAFYVEMREAIKWQSLQWDVAAMDA